MKHLYDIKIERTSYHGHKSVETVQRFLESPDQLNTGRLGGFQRDSIKVLEVTKGRKQNIIEIDADVERNELMFLVDVDEHIATTLEPWNREEEFLEAAESYDEDIEAYLVKSGFYTEVLCDNTYNYSSDFTDDIAFTVYMPRGKEHNDWIYSDDAIVLIKKHYGLDARCGYGYVGIFKGSDYEGFAYFLDFHVHLTIETQYGEHINDYDGDYAYGHVERDGYKLHEVNVETGSITLIKDGELFDLRYYHPAEGI